MLFQANVKMSAAQLAPGDKVDITVDTKCNSYVGLLGIDQSVMLLRSGIRSFNILLFLVPSSSLKKLFLTVFHMTIQFQETISAKQPYFPN
jgi:hypothetical protein